MNREDTDPSATLHAQSTRGFEAQQVLDNPTFAAAFEALRLRITTDWAECDVRDTERQKLLLQMRKVTDFFETTLRGLIEGGKLAQSRLDMDKLRDEPAGRRILRKVL